MTKSKYETLMLALLLFGVFTALALPIAAMALILPFPWNLVAAPLSLVWFGAAGLVGGSVFKD